MIGLAAGIEGARRLAVGRLTPPAAASRLGLSLASSKNKAAIIVLKAAAQETTGGGHLPPPAAVWSRGEFLHKDQEGVGAEEGEQQRGDDDKPHHDILGQAQPEANRFSRSHQVILGALLFPSAMQRKPRADACQYVVRARA